MRRRVAVLAVAGLLAVGAAGCDSGRGAGSGSPADRGTGSAPATGSPGADATPASPQALTVAQARSRYLEVVKPYNQALDRFEAAARADRDWQELLPLAGEVARTAREHGVALRQTAWPAEVRAPMAELIAENDAAGKCWERAGTARTPDELVEAVTCATSHSGAGPANRIRAALGLPAVGRS